MHKGLAITCHAEREYTHCYVRPWVRGDISSPGDNVLLLSVPKISKEGGISDGEDEKVLGSGQRIYESQCSSSLERNMIWR